MNLLAGTCYDPAVAVIKTTASGSGLAIIAMDTTNLRLAFTVPPSGFVRVRMEGVVHGATTFPSVLLAVISGTGILMRQAPVQSLGNTAVATAMVNIEADFIVSGLTAGESRTWDAAYGVETSIANTGIKYGGPNNASPGNNAFGGFSFEVWDPCPFYTPASGVPPTSPVIAYTSGIRAQTDLIPAAPASTTNITAGTITTVTNLTNAPTSGDLTATMKTSVTTAATAATPTAAAVTGAVGSVTGNVLGVVASVSGLTASNLDAAITSRMATYTQPTGFLSATFPAGTVANTTNITAGTITTTTNLTTNNDKTGYALSTAGVTAVWAEVMDGTRTAVQAMRGIMAAMLGKASGLDTNAPKYRDIGDSKNVIDATTDADGNRTAVTLDLT